jgi:hypothetical protein
VKERRILFSAPMVRALLDGTKTQTRRACKPMNEWVDQDCREVRMVDGIPFHFLKNATAPMEKLRCPYGQPGDRMWVRETWADLAELSDGNFERQAIYRADDIERYGDEDEFVDVTAPDMRWRPSIFMPRWASRILLEVVSARVERLPHIGTEEIQAEGIATAHEDIMEHGCRARVIDFSRLWEGINGVGSWDANPWVWVVEFKRLPVDTGVDNG